MKSNSHPIKWCSRVLMLCMLISVGNEQISGAGEIHKAKDFLELGQMLEFNGNPDGARAAYEKSVALDANSKEARQALARLYTREHRFEAALKQLQSVTEIAPKDIAAHIELAALFRQMGKPKDAVRVLEETETIANKNPVLEKEIGFSYLAAGDNAKAEALFLTLSQEQHEVTSYLGLAMSEFRLGKAGQAEQAIRKVLELNPEEPNAYCLLGDLELARGKREEAIAAYRKAISLAPNLPQPYISLGSLYLKGNELADAKKIFEEAQDRCPSQADILLGLAVVVEKENKPAEAVQLLEQAANLETDFAQVKSIRDHIERLRLSQ